MTVTYTAEVATCEKFGCFIKLLARWRGSIYKIIWMDLLVFLTLYYCLNFIYLQLLDNESQKTFESIVHYCGSYSSIIPLSFVLGFYVNLVMTRWWDQYVTIPWPDSIAVFVSAHVHGQDEGGRLMRRTVMRYVCLCLTIVFTMISPCVKKRFPKMKNLVDAGLLLENEKEIIEAMDRSFPKYPKHWLPIVWAASIITRAREEGRIRDDYAVKTIIDELNGFRGRCGTLMYYDFISIPLVYTQVVTIAVYSFFVCSLLAHQWTYKKQGTYEALDFYSPVFIILQFFFYAGWLKVAEALINPFGEDDDDFEVNWMIDRNLQVSYLIVDEMHHEHPELVRDQYWDEVYPNELPYESEAKREQPPKPSTAKYDLAELLKGAPSPANSVMENARTEFSVQSALSRRSQRFNDAFERFLKFSEDDAISSRTKTDIENSLPSGTDSENIEHITSFTYSDQIQFESQLETENAKEKSLLEPIIEEEEEASEVVEEEEEMSIIDEDDDKIESHSSHESDFHRDPDPFEKLRIERQQERLQRMSDYLERHFGSNFRIVTQPSAAPETKHIFNTEDVTSSKSRLVVGENIDYNSENDENLLTPTMSVSSLEDVESNAELLTPKVSKEFSVPKTSAAATEINANDENLPEEKTIKALKGNERFAHFNLPENNFPLEENILKTIYVPSTQPDLFTYTPQELLQEGSRVHDRSTSNIFPQTLAEKGSEMSIPQDITGPSSTIIKSANSSKDNILIGRSGFTEPQENVSSISNLPAPSEQQGAFPSPSPPSQPEHESRAFNNRTSKSLESSEVGMRLYNPQDFASLPRILPQSSFSTVVSSDTESDSSLKSQANSPLGSAISVSTQSSSTDDWSTVDEENPSATGEYRVEIEGPEDGNHDL